MDDVKAGKVNCIVVKICHALGVIILRQGIIWKRSSRSLEYGSFLLHRFDSFACDDAERALMVPLKNMVNDVYAKDISRKIVTSFRQRQETGDFLPANPPYGYIKSKDRQFRYDVDEKTAPYIRMLFEWKAEGVSHAEMARRLNEMGLSRPPGEKLNWVSGAQRNISILSGAAGR